MLQTGHLEYILSLLLKSVAVIASHVDSQHGLVIGVAGVGHRPVQVLAHPEGPPAASAAHCHLWLALVQHSRAQHQGVGCGHLQVLTGHQDPAGLWGFAGHDCCT